MSGGAESDEDGEIEGIDEATTEQALEQVDDEEVQQNSVRWSLLINCYQHNMTELKHHDTRTIYIYL